jgi:peptidoglycan/LPS O-acetylase OafA/YrhL
MLINEAQDSTANGAANEICRQYVSRDSRMIADEIQMTPALERHRYKTLDAWRGVACLGIVVFHSTPPFADGGHPSWVGITERIIDQFWIGVPMFFVISGYCIMATADSTRRKSHKVRTYFYRRFRRIYPPYWFFLLFGVAFALIGERLPFLKIADGTNIHSPGELDAGQWIGSVTLTETWLSTLCGRPAKFPFGHAWTLCYEEQFYAVTGIVLYLARARFVLVCNWISGLMLVAYVVVPRLGGSTVGTFLDGSWLAFGAGVWVYSARNYATSFRGGLLYAAPTGAAALLIIGRHWENVFSGGRHPGMETFILSAIAFAVCLAILSRHDEALSRIRIVAPLSWCGTICYSLYLVHVPIVHAIRHLAESVGGGDGWFAIGAVMPTCVGASLAAGWCFHRVVEVRFLNTPQSGPALSRPALPTPRLQET